MRKIEIQLDDASSINADIVKGQVLVTCDDDFQCERLYISLYGRELARVVIHAGKVTIVHEDKRDLVDEIIELGDNLTIPMGESHYDFSFTLPSNIPGSYKGAYGSIKYSLKAKAEVSWARDPKSELELDVGFSQGTNDQTIAESASDVIERDGILLLRVESDRTRFFLGDDLDFRFMVNRDTKMRGVRAEIIGVEYVEPKGHKMTSKKTLAEIYFTEDELRRDSWNEVKIPTNIDWMESFNSQVIEYKHILKVTLDIARRPDKDIEIPVFLGRSSSFMKSEFDF